MAETGEIYKVSGPVVVAEDLDAQMYDVVKVGEEGLMGEVIEIEGDKTSIQVYEDTTGIRPGEPVENTGSPLSVELGPGMLSSIYDGLQRPLPALEEQTGEFISRGETAPGVSRDETWEFEAHVEEGDEVEKGAVLGVVEEKGKAHRILVPPDREGTIASIEEGEFTVDETVAELEDGTELQLIHEWPIREAREVSEKLDPEIPLITGQRVLDALFPLAKGGVAAIPGGFGTGKCVVGDTSVMLADGTKKPIKEVYEENRGKGEETVNGDEAWTELDEPLQVLSRSGGELEQRDATVVYKGETDTTVSVETRSGRDVELTPVHKLFVLTPEMQIVEKQAQDIEEGDTLLIPRSLPATSEAQEIDTGELLSEKRVAGEDAERVREAIETLEGEREQKEIAKDLGINPGSFTNYATGRNRPPVELGQELLERAGRHTSIRTVKGERQSRPITVPETIDDRFAELFGLLLGDGSLKPTAVQFYNNDENLLERVESLLHNLFGVETERETVNTVESVRTNNVALRDLLVALGFPEEKKSLTCSIPTAILKSPDEIVAAFLRGYFLADGHPSGYEAEIYTSSERMAEDLSYALARIGIVASLGSKATAANDSYRVRIAGDQLERFYEETVTNHEKYKEIKTYLESGKDRYYGNDAVTIDTDLVMEAFEGSGKRRQDFKDEGVKIANYTTQEEQMSVPVLQTFADMVGEEHLREVAGNHLEHFHPDPVTSVTVKDKEKPVYDLTVPETHNFVGGNAPMLLHNTVTQQQLAKWSDADIIVYIGCGERGNEMTEVLDEFPELEDPWSEEGKKLMERTILIANTSNMPVAAREASIYTGITMAEYYRDQGYSVALMADSTSRWAEAMREISSRLEEMPGERGYPAYLASRLAEFYERAGRADPLGVDEAGSVSVIGAVSPPGGDFTEPVTQNTLRVTKAFWALDKDLANKRHFPAISWTGSYSEYDSLLNDWFEEEVDGEWGDRIRDVRDLLQEDEQLQETVQLVGKDALPERQQLTLETARMVKEFFLQQNAFHDVDTFCSPEKTMDILKVVLDFGNRAEQAMEEGAALEDLMELESKQMVSDIKFEEDYEALIDDIREQMEKDFERPGGEQ